MAVRAGSHNTDAAQSAMKPADEKRMVWFQPALPVPAAPARSLFACQATRSKVHRNTYNAAAAVGLEGSRQHLGAPLRQNPVGLPANRGKRVESVVTC